MEDFNYVQGFFALLISVLAGIPLHLAAINILGIAAIIWVAWFVLRDIYWRWLV